MHQIKTISNKIKDRFSANKRVLSYDEYMALVEANPKKHCRNSAEYMLDMFDFFGTEDVSHPRGKLRRFKLFNVPWANGRGRLVGQEEAQNAIYRVLHNFVRQRRVDRLILLRGPNGSSKSTISDIMAWGLEHYSMLDEGAIYKFNWIFPTQKSTRSGIGFGGAGAGKEDSSESFAHLADSEVDARILCEQRDHPLLLVPLEMRKEFFEGLKEERGERPSDYLFHGNLCQKCKLIYEALLSSYEGDYSKVLRHVQVERFYISRRYRQAAARVEPQLAVDAATRQVTVDRSFAALPTALQSITLYETDGELVHGNRGIIDYSDLLKRPLEAFKYLLTTVEDGRVSLDQANLFLDLVFVASSNEMQLNAFMESPDWMSFKGRLELVRVPYLLDYKREKEIYDNQRSTGRIGKHIGPYSTAVAALWAVLTRMHKPRLEQGTTEIKEVVSNLTPMQKAMLYSEKRIPDGLKPELGKKLKVAISDVFAETDAEIVYEGLTGASPREMKAVVMNAAQDASLDCVTPESVLRGLSVLVQDTSVYPFLRQDIESPGYYDHKNFIEQVRDWYLDHADDEIQTAMGLVEESSYVELFSRYVTHVILLLRKEKVHNPVTGNLEEPDKNLMREVEEILDVKSDYEAFRESLITKIGAWSVDNPGEKPDYRIVFPNHFEKMKNGYFEKQKTRVKEILKDALVHMTEEKSTLPSEDVKVVKEMLVRLKEKFGYCDVCAKEVITILLRTRYVD